MSGNIIQLNEDLIKNNLKDLVRDSVEETLNALLDSTMRRTSLSVLASMSGRETVRATNPCAGEQRSSSGKGGVHCSQAPRNEALVRSQEG